MVRWSWFLGGTAMLVGTLVMRSSAQISPGELSSAHASLEGIGHCTACHSLGKSISNTNCLHCHTEIDLRMRAGSGFHGTLAARQCVECHKEHHGRDFPIVKFDTRSFQHDNVQFTLIGKHASIGCRDCHRKDLLKARDILLQSDARKSTTFLGLSTECAGCHQDPHRGQLGATCTRCHGQTHWKPVDAFSHDRTKYPLTGLHASVDCLQCHPSADGKTETIRFVGIKFSTCTACHRDPHAGKFTGRCERCHTTNGWLDGATRNFDHASTRYPLLGKHRRVRCEQCHGAGVRQTSVRPGDRAPFRIAHFSRCADCHGDPHNHQFAKDKDRGACEGCHTVDGYVPSTFSIERHKLTAYPLRGAHRAVPCIRCHPSGPAGGKARMIFRRPGFAACTTCHDDIHAGEFNGRMAKGCETCHTTERWTPAFFSHAGTRFPLDGKHRNVPCGQCHPARTVGGKLVRQYTGIPITCEGCHGPDRADHRSTPFFQDHSR